MTRRLLLLALAGCAAAPVKRTDAARDLAALNEAVLAYWQALRWGDQGDLMIYFPKPADQLKIATAYAEARVRMQDSQVLHVVMGDALPKERAPATREGIVAVRVEAFDAQTGRLIMETFEQHWLRVDGRWVVDTEKSPLGEARLW
jgi:hypothetical protein